MSGRYDREDCYFCHGGDDVVETHHIVPRRLDGGDGAANLVKVCPTCHRKLEALYDSRFYERVYEGMTANVSVEVDALLNDL